MIVVDVIVMKKIALAQMKIVVDVKVAGIIKLLKRFNIILLNLFMFEKNLKK
jgi:hypothetical protein